MGIPGYMAVCILAAIFLGVDKAIYAICICMLSIIAIGYGVSSGDLLISVDAAVFNTSKGAWTATSIVFFVTIGSLILCLAGLMGALMTLVGRVQEQGAELMVCHDHLEELVADRTLELTKEIEVREEREIALKISEERFKGFADVAADRYWESDANHNIIYAPSVSKIVRELNVTILGKLAWETDLALSEEDKVALKNALESKKEFRDLKICWILPNGEKFYRRLSGAPLRDHSGKFSGFRVIGIDETAEVVAQGETRSTQMRFFNALDQFDIGVVLWDPDGVLQFMNKAIENLYPHWQGILEVGVTYQEFCEFRWEYLNKLGTMTEDKASWVGKDVANLSGLSTTQIVKRPNGRISKAYCRKLDDGWLIGIHVDVSAENYTEWELAEAKNRADEADSAKSKFISSIGFELRTPLSAILGLNNMVARDFEDGLKHKYSNYLQQIRMSGESLLGLIDGILELSQVESGPVELDIQNFDFSDDFVNCISELRLLADERGVEVIQNVSPDELPRLRADQKLFRDAFNHLLVNAANYNKKGGKVEISTQELPDGLIRFTVKDNGQGISRDRKSGIFAPFEWLGQEAGNIAGTGVGLCVTKHYIEQMNGRIDFLSTAGEGSSFWIDIPLADSERIASREKTLDA